MDLINETEIKDECLEYIDNDGNSTQCLDQVLRYDELQEKNYIDVKREIEVKNEPLDIVKENDDPLNIEEEDSINGELVEPSSELNENQCEFCIIEDLLKRPFRLHTLQEKLSLIQNGRPCLELPNLKAPHKDKGQEYVRHFQATQYEKTEWLAGSVKLNRLFCWPCLMFAKEETVWSKLGYGNLNNLHNAINKHEKTQSHIFSDLQIKTFGSSHIDVQLDSQLLASVGQHNEMVRKNREILKRFIDTVCFLAIHELPFQVHCESQDSVKGVYLGTLNYLAKYDAPLSVHLQNSSTFLGTSNRIQNDLVLSVANVVTDKIKEEVSKTPFVAIMLDETSDIINESQLSTSLRYFDSETGEIKERFISFTDVSSDRSSSGLLKHVENIVSEFNLGEKLIAQTFDGAADITGHRNGLRAKVLEKYHKAIFVHYFSHKLNLILSQTLTHLKECRTFFQTLSGLGSFFQRSSKRSHGLKEYTSKKMPRHAPKRWNFASRLVQILKEHRAAFIGFFEDILDNSGNWDSETVIGAQGFLKFLTCFHTSLLLVIFSKVFSYTDILSKTLQSKSLDIQYCCNKIEETKNHIQNLRKVWDSLWVEIQDYHNDIDGTPPNKTRRTEQPLEVSKKVLFNEIIDMTVVQIDERFSSMNNLNFVSLLNPQKYSEYKMNFPVSTFIILKNVHSDTFDFIRLKNELIVLYSYKEFGGLYPSQLVNTLKKKMLQTALPEVYKLGLLIITIPCTTTSVERSFSALRRIQSYRRSKQGQDRLENLGLLSIEKDLLNTLMQSTSFYENVINKFIKQEKRMDFTFQ
ncbi:UNVERIFIED_CONTAM: hypothetical protein RMT77_015178 [Armadillidium vulgare]